MRRNILNRWALVLIMPLVFGCKTKRQIVQQNPDIVTKDTISDTVVASPQSVIAAVPSTTMTPEILSGIKQKQITFNTFSTRAKTDLAIAGKNNDVTMNIRIEKDKAIWVSVTALVGLEVARVYITPDSIKIRDNINSVYIKKPFDFIHTITNGQVNFNTAQSLFIGNAIPEFLTDSAAVTPSGSNTRLSGSIGNLIYSWLFNPDLKPLQASFQDQVAQQSLNISYADFATIAGRTLPQSVSIKSSAAGKEISVRMNYSRTEFDVPVDMPFSVPSRFKVKE